ncbi:unnamed protein product [Boreogadus saida]
MLPTVRWFEEKVASDSVASAEVDEGLVFEVSEQALVRYSVRSWSEFSEFLGDSWRPAGSVYDVDVVNKDPSVLKFIHFPHSLCLAEPEHELSFSVLHVKERHANIETTVDFTASHVKWSVSSLSPPGSHHSEQSAVRFGERPFELFLKDSDCDEPLWSATIREEDWKFKKKPSVKPRREQSQGQKSSQSGEPWKMFKLLNIVVD